jgi:hypothetical protein
MEKGEKGYLVCKYAFKVRWLLCHSEKRVVNIILMKRLPNQPPIPEGDDDLDPDTEGDPDSDSES